MFKRSHVLMDGTPGAAGGGDPPAAPAAPAAPTAAAPAAHAAPAAPSALTPPPAPPTEFIPEKFRVLGADGKALDIEASARKMAESYAHLEGRVGSGDVPPKTADDYAVTVPEQFKEHWEENDRSKAFKAEALAAGFKDIAPIAEGDFPGLAGGDFTSLAGQTFDIVINATSASLSGEALPLPAGLFAAGSLAYDMMYGKGDTPFISLAREQGAGALADGLGMLLEQAAEAFTVWRGVRPDTAGVLADLRQQLAK